MAEIFRRDLKRTRRKSYSESEPTPKRRFGSYSELRILLPNKVAGAIIGRCGENILKLRRKFLANINLPTCIGPERVLTITAELPVICKILGDIIPTISLELNGRCSDHNELRMLLNRRQAGAVIGRRGNTVRELKEKSGSTIKVFEECCPDSTDQVVQMRGSTQNIVNCVRAILTRIVHNRSAKYRNRYDPNNHDAASASKYGGYDYKGMEVLRSQCRTHRNGSISSSDALSDVCKSPSMSSLSTIADSEVSSTLDSIPASTSITPRLRFICPSGSRATNNKSNSATKDSSIPILNQSGSDTTVKECDLVEEPHLSGTRISQLESLISPAPGYDWNSSVMENALMDGDGIVPGLFSDSILSSSTSGKCLTQLLKALSSLVSSSPLFTAAEIGKHLVAKGNIMAAQTNTVANDYVRRTKPVMTSQLLIPQELIGVVFGKNNGRMKYLETKTLTKIWSDDVIDRSSDCVINITGSAEQITCALEHIQFIVQQHRYGNIDR